MHDPQRLHTEWGHAAWMGGGAAPAPAWAAALLPVLGLLVLLALLAWLAHRLFRRWAGEGSGQGMAVDREDLALLRTARQAMGFLLAKRLKQFKVARLVDRMRDRGGGGGP